MGIVIGSHFTSELNMGGLSGDRKSPTLLSVLIVVGESVRSVLIVDFAIIFVWASFFIPSSVRSMFIN